MRHRQLVFRFPSEYRLIYLQSYIEGSVWGSFGSERFHASNVHRGGLHHPVISDFADAH